MTDEEFYKAIGMEPPSKHSTDPKNTHLAFLQAKVCPECAMWWPIGKKFPPSPGEKCGVCQVGLKIFYFELKGEVR